MAQAFPATMPCLNAAFAALPHLLRAVAKTLNAVTVLIEPLVRAQPGPFERLPHLLRAVAKTLNTVTVLIKASMGTVASLSEFRFQPLNFSHKFWKVVFYQ